MRHASSRHVHVEHVMGTAVSFDLRDDTHFAASAIRDACDWLHEVDRTFSPYRPDSVISRLDRGELVPADAGHDVNLVLTACAALREQSDGAFDVRATRRLDPSAYVKGWATERAARTLEAYGLRNFQINAGGDVVVRGDAGDPGGGWRIGIRHPTQAGRFAAVACLHDQAIATSALYERGRHIVDPSTGRPASGVSSVTVVAAHLGQADAWATAVFAAGPRLLQLAASRDDVETLLILADTLVYSAGFPLCDRGALNAARTHSELPPKAHPPDDCAPIMGPARRGLRLASPSLAGQGARAGHAAP